MENNTRIGQLTDFRQFHDEYLPAFNKPNVTLVDTNGKGVDQITPTGIQFDGREYDVDVLVLSTGFVSPGKNARARC